MKKILFVILVLPLIFGNFAFAQFQVEKVEIHFFWSQGCPHCSAEKSFLEGLQEKYPKLEIKQYEFSKNVELVTEFYQDYGVPVQEQGLVPVTFIGERYFVGFDEKTGQEIENHILGKEPTPPTPEKIINIPFLGETDISGFSLPVLAVILGFFDGFNVCSLGALVLILGLVLVLKSRRRILIFGGVFILTTAIVYGILIILWHQLFLVLSPYIRKMEIVIGVLALVGGGYFLREFLKFRKRGPVCEFGGISENLSKRIQSFFEKKASILTLTGIIFLFSAIITIIEFPCSAVLPVLFAGILSQTYLPSFLYFIYIAIFILFYMLDEIIVFLISVFTMKIWIASPKFITFLNLIASILLSLLGFYYLFGLI